MKIGLAVALLSTIVGTSCGALAGYFGKATDQVLMRLTDLFLVVPAIAMLALILKLFGHSDLVIILVLAALYWIGAAHASLVQFLLPGEKVNVEAAVA